jgi:hypothetical protein
MWTIYKCQICSVGLCFYPCFRVFHTKLQFSENTSHGKVDYMIIRTIFHYVWIFFEYQYIVLYNKGKVVWIL